LRGNFYFIGWYRNELLRDIVWQNSVSQWSGGELDGLTTIRVESIFFKEFRYQFDSSCDYQIRTGTTTNSIPILQDTGFPANYSGEIALGGCKFSPLPLLLHL